VCCAQCYGERGGLRSLPSWYESLFPLDEDVEDIDDVQSFAKDAVHPADALIKAADAIGELIQVLLLVSPVPWVLCSGLHSPPLCAARVRVCMCAVQLHRLLQERPAATTVWLCRAGDGAALPAALEALGAGF
jgi:hypothetical protein